MVTSDGMVDGGGTFCVAATGGQFDGAVETSGNCGVGGGSSMGAASEGAEVREVVWALLMITGTIPTHSAATAGKL